MVAFSNHLMQTSFTVLAANKLKLNKNLLGVKLKVSFKWSFDLSTTAYGWTRA